MTVFQFEFRHPRSSQGGADIVIDVTADDQASAVDVMRLLARGWDSCDDPITVDDELPGIYARVWINLKADSITADDIVDEWEEHNDA